MAVKKTYIKPKLKLASLFETQLLLYVKSGYKKPAGLYFDCGTPQRILSNYCGMDPNLHIVILPKDMDKILGLDPTKDPESHNLRVKHIKNFPRLLNTPILVMTGHNSCDVLVFVKISFPNRMVYAAIEVSKYETNIKPNKVHLIQTAFSKDIKKVGKMLSNAIQSTEKNIKNDREGKIAKTQDTGEPIQIYYMNVIETQKYLNQMNTATERMGTKMGKLKQKALYYE